ncbi:MULTISPECIES: hypothetical protein [Bradyrhizobium]|nr:MULTISPECIES: hypothetical protein [Bradyrhizobium]
MARVRTIIVRPVNRSSPLPEKKERHWIAFSISAVSFVISVLSFFFSTLLEADDVRMVIEHTPSVGIDAHSGELIISGNVGLAFVNSGNRSASIMNVKATSRKATIDEGIGAKCSSDKAFGTDWFDFGVEPFVLKPGDIMNVQSKALKGGGVSPKKGEKDTYKLNKDTFSPKVGDVILVCAETNLVTPDSLILAWKLPILRYLFKNDTDFGLTVEEEPLFDAGKPIVLINRNKWFGKLTAALKP